MTASSITSTPRNNNATIPNLQYQEHDLGPDRNAQSMTENE